MLNTARIAKNTIFLYMRMIRFKGRNKKEEVRRGRAALLNPSSFLLIPLHLIVGFVTLFTLPWHAEASGEGRLNGALMSTVQRFLCFWLFVALSLLIFLASELLAPANLLPSSFSLLPLLRSLSSFFSWSILGAIANMLREQGLNVLLNLFFGAPSLPRRSLGEVGNPHCRVPLFICRERGALTRFPRQFCGLSKFNHPLFLYACR